MTIRALSQQEFDRFASARSTLADLTNKSVEWLWTTRASSWAIARHDSDANWSLVVLVRDDDAEFHLRGLDFGLSNVDHARTLLFASMEAALDGKALAPTSAASAVVISARFRQ